MTIIGITMGCPAGIGPEIILKYFNLPLRPQKQEVVVLGDTGVLQKCGSDLQLTANCVDWHPGTTTQDGTIPVCNLSSLGLQQHNWGHPDRDTATAMVRYITRGVSLVQEGHLDGIVTCPISKKSLQDAGEPYPGHTEMLAALTNTKTFTMMLAGKSLKVTLATIHTSLAEVPKLLTRNGIYQLITITNEALRYDFGLTSPKIAVAGLNPHSGEQGMFGMEEKEIIIPAVQQAREQEIDVYGPYPPDTVFFQAAAGKFDAVVCMYHDQGLIPFKLLHFKDGVNVTLGLPIVRTSVDHGTAYDIAGQGCADHSSLEAAITLADQISAHRKLSTSTMASR